MTAKLLYSAREAADALGCSMSYLYQLAASGRLERRYLGRSLRITADSLAALVDELPTEPPAPPP